MVIHELLLSTLFYESKSKRKIGGFGKSMNTFHCIHFHIYLGTSSKTEGPEYHNQEYGSDYTDNDSGL